MAKSADIRKVLSPELMQSLKGLELLSQLISEELSYGQHKSTQSGQGQEFSQYRSYEPGDDPRMLDWKMYARSDRYYVRLAEVETRVKVTCLIDATASMKHEWQGVSKLDYARVMAAGVAYVANQFNDAFGLIAENDKKTWHLPPQSGYQQFHQFLHSLLQIRASGSWAVRPLFSEDTAALYVLFSDGHQQHHEIMDWVKQIKHKRNEVVVFQLLAPDELHPSEESVLLEDWESGKTLVFGGKKAAEEVAERMKSQTEKLQQELLQKEIGYVCISLDESPIKALRTFLQKRKKLRL
ncbi:DUF58 domain-containing protein [Cytophagales bacterium LB-30]|uniref:DUF58 domain-containing protein n=1 Tax=Shiella aurantiaca TaxID=3058365 RepID=A0ABT8F0Q7_9BACT|nr:DUF58 domain-containing protein [Shiella aurantiaca]MDN4164020.1 DUF58 domain-containing protein [Shiella aurantiaca]